MLLPLFTRIPSSSLRRSDSRIARLPRHCEARKRRGNPFSLPIAKRKRTLTRSQKMRIAASALAGLLAMTQNVAFSRHCEAPKGAVAIRISFLTRDVEDAVPYKRKRLVFVFSGGGCRHCEKGCSEAEINQICTTEGRIKRGFNTVKVKKLTLTMLPTALPVRCLLSQGASLAHILLDRTVQLQGQVPFFSYQQV